jgi:CheY-like chemotaxis protein
MYLSSGYILLIAKQPHKVRVLLALLNHSGYSVEIAATESQAIAQTRQHLPFLIILVGNHTHWSEELLQGLRVHANNHHSTLIALTDFHAPSWIHQEENPGFDGFLVNPISIEVLSSLIQSAHTRQICCPVG